MLEHLYVVSKYFRNLSGLHKATKLSSHDCDWSLELLFVETPDMQSTVLTTKNMSVVSQLWFVEMHSRGVFLEAFPQLMLCDNSLMQHWLK